MAGGLNDSHNISSEPRSGHCYPALWTSVVCLQNSSVMCNVIRRKIAAYVEETIFPRP